MSKRGTSARQVKETKVQKAASEKGSEKGSQKGKGKEKGEDLSRFVKGKTTLADVEDMQKCFELFDSDKSGVITVSELVSGFIALGLEERSKDICKLVESYEKKRGYSELGFPEFMEMFSPPETESEDSLRQVFEAYDKDGKGYIVEADFKRVSEELSQKFTAMEIQLMFMHADKDKDGKLTFEEFQLAIQRARR